MAKKLKNEKALLAEALRMILDDAVQRGVVEFEPTDSHDLKIEYAYRLLIHDKAIAQTRSRCPTYGTGWPCG
jgi:hypothetical protein